MTVQRTHLDYLNDIVQAMEKVAEFIHGMDFEAFRQDDKTIYAVIRALEVIGEATKQLSSPIREKHKLVPWQAMAGMRDKLIHAYFGINLKVVWRTATEDIVELKPIIEMILEQEKRN